jgi:hypothetical protein
LRAAIAVVAGHQLDDLGLPFDGLFEIAVFSGPFPAISNAKKATVTDHAATHTVRLYSFVH